jgi:hypothetical protein
MRLTRAAGPEEQCVFPFAEKSAGSQVENQTAIHLRIEGEVEVVQGLLRVAEGSLFAPPFEQSLAAPGQLIGDQARDQTWASSPGAVSMTAQASGDGLPCSFRTKRRTL